MKKCKVCDNTKPLTDFHKNKTYSYGYASKCKECHKAQCKEGYLKYKPQRKAAIKEWAEKNRGKCNAANSKYRASLRNATVSWADEQYIKDLYENTKEASEIFGVLFEVDHRVPLQHPKACGLHNEYNLQVLTKADNCSKQNRWID